MDDLCKEQRDEELKRLKQKLIDISNESKHINFSFNYYNTS